MSKKKKVSSGKAAKKGAAKKPVKKASKPVAKKITKKPATKSLASKKPAAKKVVNKPTEKKAAPAKKPLKKAATPVKKATKPLAKVKKPLTKALPPKKSGKPEAKSKPVASKPVAKATSSKPLAKPEVSSNGKDKKLKSHIVVPAPVFKKETKKDSPAPAANSKTAAEPSKKNSDKGGDKKSDVLAITNTIPVKKQNEISMSKIASISHSITNPVRKTDSYSVRPEKEPNGKFEMEFVVHSSAEMLYEFLSTPSGLSEWFCDDLNIRNGIYTFIWDDQLQQARLLKTIDLQVVRFQWVDKTDGSYFEFRIQRDDLTNDIALIITDFADTASERESSKLLWHSQIEKLMHVIGSIF